ncbi:probable methyltransferase-like protein 24 [Carassius gibelio]|uniref:probable methyltransferase-like protein 24 n=1 Tax=Carassius gibelio TaxID=101364 RepID=UPI0022791C58|nr:probable methyltransferase-like protein 24 [Carassius gibelio]XP_052442430.1 probable methyltransferase-like protein 24 [Carassius gibelio]
MDLLCSCRTRTRTSVCRLCLLLSLLCVCAHVYMQLQAPRKHSQHHHRSVATATDAAADAGSTCCSALHHHRRRVSRWKIRLEPWAAGTGGFQEEADRFLRYISTPQLSCQRPASVPPVFDAMHRGSWLLCLDHRFSLVQRIVSKHCRVYSLRLGAEDDSLERVLAGSGCEVHCFDPSISRAHLQEGNMWLHRLSVDWRDPNPAVPVQRLHSGSKKLSAILSHFGHRRVDVLKVDLESAEWKILENLILEQVLDSVGLLLLELHLQWAGFEVGGDEPSVVRYWFSLLKELERAHFRLYHSYSDPSKPRLFLHRNLRNTSSSFTLGWVNTRFTL